MPPSKPDSYEAGVARVVSGRAQFTQTALSLIAAARRDIALLSFNLDPSIYNRDDIYTALKDFILLSPRSRMRILLNDAGPAARGHRVVELGRTLSSFVEFRVLDERQRDVHADWLIIDQKQVLERRTPEHLEAHLYSDDPRFARTKYKQFEKYWQSGVPASALRPLHLS